jgi:glycosyltransferase involved in cell wall biosynthesis
MPSKIAFVATGYIKKYDGVSVYTENLLKEFLALEFSNKSERGIDIYIGKSVRKLLEERVIDSTQSKTGKIRFIEIADSNFFVKMGDLVVKLLLNGRYNLIFATNFMPFFLLPSKVVKVIHDLSPEVSPHLYSSFFKFYHSFLLKSGKWFDNAIGYISEATKNDLEKFYQITEKNKKLVYLPNGVPFKVKNYKRPDISVLDKYDSKEVSFLVVGRINKAKGFDRILEFCSYFDEYLKTENEFKGAVLHIAGKQTDETKEIFKNSNFSKIEVIFHGYLDDDSLNALYTKSQFCFFLSRNEGYGLPLVEALWFRSIPIISDIPIFNEIMGKDYPKFSDKMGYSVTVNNFLTKVLKEKDFLKVIIDKLELILEREQDGYKRSAANLIEFINSLEKVSAT